MRSLGLLTFLLIPAMAALGHDLYLFYQNQEKGFEFAALGFIWTRYEPESYKSAVEITTPDGYWPYINFILAQKAVLVGVVFAAIMMVFIGLLQLLGVGGERKIKAPSGSRRSDEIMGKKSAKYKYNRK
ncbi:MAG: hypothetical protein WBK77_03535 [Alphaproteobacteria bacterium]